MLNPWIFTLHIEVIYSMYMSSEREREKYIYPKVPKTFKKNTVNVTPFRILDFEGFQIWTMCGDKHV